MTQVSSRRRSGGAATSALLIVVLMVLAGALLGAVGGFVARTISPSSYDSTMTFYVAVPPESTLEVTNTPQLIELRARSYADIAQSNRVVDDVSELLGLTQEDPFAFTAAHRDGTSLLDVTATSDSSERAVASLETLSSYLPQEVGRLDSGGGADQNSVSLQLVVADPPGKAEPRLSRLQATVYGALAGAALVGAAIFGRRYLKRGAS